MTITTQTFRERIYNILKDSPVALRGKDLIQITGCSYPALGTTFSIMRNIYPDFVQEKKQGHIFYAIGVEKLTNSSNLKVYSTTLLISPKDLWRGWINPITKIIPPKLGF